jgi:hypothetical protein
MRYHEITEAPLDGYELHGDWSDQETHDPQPAIHADKTPSAHHLRQKYGDNSFVSKFDRALIQKPETEAALRKVFARFNIPIYLFFLNSEAGRQIAVHYLDFGKLKNTTSLTNPNSGHARMKDLLGPGIYSRIREIHGAHPDACIIILTHNEGGDKRHPLTPWMIVHRIAHAYGPGGNFLESKTTDLWAIADAYRLTRESVHDIVGLRFDISRAICTFRAAREDNILDNSGVEIGAELFTQFVMQGRVKLQLPAEIRGKPLDPAQKAKAEAALRNLEDYANAYLGAAEGNLKGTVHVC